MDTQWLFRELPGVTEAPDMLLIRRSGEIEHIFGWHAQEVVGKRMEEFSWIFDDDEAQTAFSANRNYREDCSVAADLELANEKLRLVPFRLIEVQENERKRLAGELHDSIGQTLAALKFRIEHVIATLEKRQSRQALQLLHEFIPILQRSIDETRSICMGLKPTILGDHGLLATLEWYRGELVRFYPNQHIQLETTVAEEDIPAHLKNSIFRIVQEALNNTFKHGRAERVDVRLALNDAAIELEISDDGIGMDLDSIMESCTGKSLGLIGMRERTQFTGGVFTIESAPNEGTKIKAVWGNHSKRPCLLERL